jgi:CDP-diacylglycerol---glycerol-3-phosphate 3-phosphatidyltransferase
MFISWLKRIEPDLFLYKTAEKVHLHDELLYKYLLRFFSERVTPNKITLLRIVCTPLIVFTLVLGHFVLGSILFLVVAGTDALDGSLARKTGRITNMGILLDPLADKLLIGSMVLVLVFDYFSPWIGWSILVLEIVFILVAFVARVQFKTVRMANLWGKLKMIAQVVAIFLTLMALLLKLPALLTIATWFFGVAIGFAVISLFSHGV